MGLSLTNKRTNNFCTARKCFFFVGFWGYTDASFGASLVNAEKEAGGTVGKGWGATGWRGVEHGEADGG